MSIAAKLAEGGAEDLQCRLGSRKNPRNYPRIIVERQFADTAPVKRSGGFEGALFVRLTCTCSNNGRSDERPRTL